MPGAEQLFEEVSNPRPSFSKFPHHLIVDNVAMVDSIIGFA